MPDEIKKRVEATMCLTYSSDGGEKGIEGRISRDDFDALMSTIDALKKEAGKVDGLEASVQAVSGSYSKLYEERNELRSKLLAYRKRCEDEGDPATLIERGVAPNNKVSDWERAARNAGWTIVFHSGAGFRAIRNDAATDDDVTDYATSRECAAMAACEISGVEPVGSEGSAKLIPLLQRGIILEVTNGGRSHVEVKFDSLKDCADFSDALLELKKAE